MVVNATLNPNPIIVRRTLKGQIHLNEEIHKSTELLSLSHKTFEYKIGQSENLMYWRQSSDWFVFENE